MVESFGTPILSLVPSITDQEYIRIDLRLPPETIREIELIESNARTAILKARSFFLD